ncbi:hypothetical protein HNY73_021722 [Argiope bruennichi]|uniref:Uncharacterized protein n=1 Tax=Argiope bruennichi TaxID=94029 RepID=A0A8T0E0A7_ARGBR|nr:hypothetical protein HNY73_021722 [Argiope bruennichi]
MFGRDANYLPSEVAVLDSTIKKRLDYGTFWSREKQQQGDLNLLRYARLPLGRRSVQPEGRRQPLATEETDDLSRNSQSLETILRNQKGKKVLLRSL